MNSILNALRVRNTSKAKRSGGHHQGGRVVTIGDSAECLGGDRDREVNRESTRQRMEFHVGEEEGEKRQEGN